MLLKANPPLADYLLNKGIQTAVDNILNEKNGNIVSGLEWSELPDYYKSYLSSVQVQIESALFLHEAWEKVWKPALDRHNISSLVPLNEMIQIDSGLTPSVAKIWESWDFYKCFVFPDENKWLYTTISLRTDAITISLGLWGDKEESLLAANSMIDESWNPDLDESGYLTTKDDFCKIDPETKQFDLEQLCEAAQKGIEFIVNGTK